MGLKPGVVKAQFSLYKSQAFTSKSKEDNPNQQFGVNKMPCGVPPHSEFGRDFSDSDLEAFPSGGDVPDGVGAPAAGPHHGELQQNRHQDRHEPRMQSGDVTGLSVF